MTLNVRFVANNVMQHNTSIYEILINQIQSTLHEAYTNSTINVIYSICTITIGRI